MTKTHIRKVAELNAGKVTHTKWGIAWKESGKFMSFTPGGGKTEHKSAQLAIAYLLSL